MIPNGVYSRKGNVDDPLFLFSSILRVVTRPLLSGAPFTFSPPSSLLLIPNLRNPEIRSFPHSSDNMSLRTCRALLRTTRTYYH